MLICYTHDQTALTTAMLYWLSMLLVTTEYHATELISDRGPASLSKLVSEMCKVVGVKKVITAYHPRMDGLVEKFNRILIDKLSRTVTRRIGKHAYLCALGIPYECPGLRTRLDEGSSLPALVWKEPSVAHPIGSVSPCRPRAG